MADSRDPEPFINETDKRQSISQASSVELKHGFMTTLTASGFPLQASLKADCVEGDLNWNPLNFSPFVWQPAVFAVSPAAGGINGFGRIGRRVASTQLQASTNETPPRAKTRAIDPSEELEEYWQEHGAKWKRQLEILDVQAA